MFLVIYGEEKINFYCLPYFSQFNIKIQKKIFFLNFFLAKFINSAKKYNNYCFVFIFIAKFRISIKKGSQKKNYLIEYMIYFNR